MRAVFIIVINGGDLRFSPQSVISRYRDDPCSVVLFFSGCGIIAVYPVEQLFCVANKNIRAGSSRADRFLKVNFIFGALRNFNGVVRKIESDGAEKRNERTVNAVLRRSGIVKQRVQLRELFTVAAVVEILADIAERLLPVNERRAVYLNPGKAQQISVVPVRS